MSENSLYGWVARYRENSEKPVIYSEHECLNYQYFRTHDEARTAIYWYVEVLYLGNRLHTGDEDRTPEEYIIAAEGF